MEYYVPKRFSYQVALFIKSTDKNGEAQEEICGGSLISRRWVLTAANCFNNLNVTSLTIRAGSLYLSKGGQLVNLKPSAITIHPQYDQNTKDFDVAVIDLGKDIDLDYYTMPITMAEEEPPAGSMLTVSGWGVTDDGTNSEVLQFMEVPVLSLDICKQYYERFTENMMCAGVPGGLKNYGKGDSGGPAVRNGILAGVISDFYNDGITCMDPGKPGLYTIVAKLRPWINKVTGI